jgi:hypothetical protein
VKNHVRHYKAEVAFQQLGHMIDDHLTCLIDAYIDNFKGAAVSLPLAIKGATTLIVVCSSPLWDSYE